MNTVTSRDGTRIAYDRYGQGPPLIMVDGAFGHRAFNPGAAQIGEMLGSRFTVIAYDRRGRGDSGDTAPYAVEREIEDIAALIDATGGSANLYGISSGAVLALRATAAGLPVAKLALYEPPFIVNDGRPPLPDGYIARLDELVASDRRGDAVEYFMTAAVGLPAEYAGAMREEPFWPVMESVAHTLAYDGRVMGETMSGEPLSDDRWTSIPVPVLVMAGGDTEPFMRDAAVALAEYLPTARHKALQGQTHQVSPESLAPALEEFFAG